MRTNYEDSKNMSQKRSVHCKPELPQDLIDLPEVPVRRNRKSKSEKLRELTEKLKQSWLSEDETNKLEEEREIPVRSASFSQVDKEKKADTCTPLLDQLTKSPDIKVNDGWCHLVRSDSLSEGENDTWKGGGSGSGFSGGGGARTPSPRRYNKRPLRGPYGEMLEAEMKRASPAKLYPVFVETPRRKTSEYQMSSSSSSSSSTHIIHQRAASSPSQLMSLDEQDRNKDTRTHVVIELYETEKSYVEALQTLVTKYLNPLKSSENACPIDACIVDEIFFQVPSLLQHHEAFLDDLTKRLDIWDIRQKIGDIFLEVFTRQPVIDCYTAFINNWQHAKSAIRNTCHSKPAFARFLDATAREHKGKLALDSLLIMPVQRIPRYELLIQTLLKHTSLTHPDHPFLVSAQRAIHALAVTINCREKESYEAEQNIQQLRDLEILLDGAGRLAIPERTFLRYDAVSATIGGNTKERMLFLFSDMIIIASMKRRSGTIRKTSTGISTGTLEANKYKSLMKLSYFDVEILKAKDESVRRLLQELSDINDDLTLTNRIIEMTNQLHCTHIGVDESLKELQAILLRQLTEKQSGETALNCLELSLIAPGETLMFMFGNPEQRSAWEKAFIEAKQKLDEKGIPEFLAPVAIRKTRSGLQFTCATATFNRRSRDVWVCNSDGYVGQVCILNLQKEPTVTSCNGVCNSRILCIAAVPVSCGSYELSKAVDAPRLHARNTSSSSEDEDDDDDIEEEEEDEDFTQPTMWLGTEDGFIYIYNSTQNIRIKKSKIKIHHGSAIHCILYYENRVFVSLANGDVAVYMRDPKTYIWNVNEATIVPVGSPSAPVSRMICVGNEGIIWCACHNVIRILNANTLIVQGTLTVSTDFDKTIQCLTSYDFSVWLSLYNSSNVSLYNGITMEVLYDVNVGPAVTKILATGCDDIIRQHKAACLRVTSLLASQDLVWVGTSAGVLLTIPTNGNRAPIIGIPHGHTGHVRFLTYVEHSENKKNLVISGGDGYEDFRTSGISEIAGREDSTNHLLLWRV